MDTDFLRKNCKKEPWHHGLGFIKLCMKGYELNFHSSLISSPTKNLHSHTKNFISTCLFGEIKNITYDYEVAKDTEWVLEKVTCTANEKPTMIHANVKPIIKSQQLQKQGDTIFHRYNQIHDTRLISQHACTKLVNEPRVKDAFIIRNKNKPFECAYKNLGNSSENWDIIDAIISSHGR